MERESRRSRSRDKHKKEKKEKKEKKDKKEKREKRDKKDKKDKKEKREKEKRWSQDKVRPAGEEEEEQEGFKSYYQKIEQYREIRNGIEYKVYKDGKRTIKTAVINSAAPIMIEVIVNDRMGRKVRVKCYPSDTIGDLKKLTSAQIGTRADKLRFQKGNRVFKDHITVSDYEISHGSCLDMYYN